MTRFTDGKKTIEITMYEIKDGNRGEDFSNDFFEVGGLQFDEELHAYIVDDVDYCADQADDWEKCIGDYYDDAEYVEEYEVERCVVVR